MTDTTTGAAAVGGITRARADRPGGIDLDEQTTRRPRLTPAERKARHRARAARKALEAIQAAALGAAVLLPICAVWVWLALL